MATVHKYWKRETFTAGFSAALGVAALVALLFAGWRIGAATIAVGTPFVASFVVALVLEPLVMRVQRNVSLLKNRRLPSVLLVYFLFLLAFVALMTYFAPKVVDQGKTLVANFPTYVNSLRGTTNRFLTAHPKIGPIAMPKNVDAFVNKYPAQINARIQTYVGDSAQILLGSIGFLLNVVLVPIITFFILTDLSRLRARFLFLLPDRVRPGFQRIASDVGGVFGNYVRGMVIVCSAYGVAAMGLFFLFHLNAYAILLGFAAGLLYAVPYLGALTTVTLAGVVSLSIGNSPGVTLLLLALLFSINIVFDNALVPRVVGDSVGLHPLLTIFALFLGGELFGIWGMLLSVPVGASIQVVLFRIFPKLCEATPVGMALRYDSPEAETVTRSKEEVDSDTEQAPPLKPEDDGTARRKAEIKDAAKSS